MYFTPEVVVSKHAILRYSQRINYLLSTYEIEDIIKKTIDKEACHKWGTHYQLIKGKIFIVSGVNEVITITYKQKKHKDKIWK